MAAPQTLSLDSDLLNNGFGHNDTLIDSNDPLSELIDLETMQLLDDYEIGEVTEEEVDQYLAI